MFLNHEIVINERITGSSNRSYRSFAGIEKIFLVNFLSERVIECARGASVGRKEKILVSVIQFLWPTQFNIQMFGSGMPVIRDFQRTLIYFGIRPINFTRIGKRLRINPVNNRCITLEGWRQYILA